MEVTWPNILRIISNLDAKLSTRISTLEDSVFADTSTTSGEPDGVHRTAAKTAEAKRSDPEAGSTEADSLPCPTLRDGSLEARVSALQRTMSEVEVMIVHLQQQQHAEGNRLESCDWDSQALSESLKDLLFSLRHEVESRDKQVKIIGRRLSDVCKQEEQLEMQIDELAYRLDSGLPGQLSEAMAATEILTHGLGRLAVRVERLETDKRGSQNSDMQVPGFLPPHVAALEDEIRGMHRICEEDGSVVRPQNSKAPGNLSDRMGALECKTSAMTRVMRLLAEQTCIVSAAKAARGSRTQALPQDVAAEISEMVKLFDAKGFDDSPSSGSSSHLNETTDHQGQSGDEASIAVLGDAKSQQHAFFEAQPRLKGRVRRLVKQFGGTSVPPGGMEEEAAETYCDSNRSALSVVTGFNESNGAMSSRSDATRWVPVSSAAFDNQPCQEQDRQQPQQQQRFEFELLTPRGRAASTRPVSSRDYVPRWCSPAPMKVTGSSPARNNSRAPNAV